jgi:DNA-binding response OmpR family regulator
MTRVLVVDDEVLTRQIVRTVLEANDYDVFEAADGAAALELIESQHPDLVLLDVAMPGIDGIEVCRRVNGSCKVVMLTAHDDPVTEKASRAAGADAFLVKPFSSVELIDRVESMARE